MAASNNVNHPPHYTQHPTGVECIEIIEHYPFNIGAAIKYLWRADLKGNPIEDLKKASWFIQREIVRRLEEGLHDKEDMGNIPADAFSGSCRLELE